MFIAGTLGSPSRLAALVGLTGKRLGNGLAVVDSRRVIGQTVVDRLADVSV